MDFGQLFVAVDLTLRRTEHGGRRTPIIGEQEGSYRPNWSVEVANPKEQTGAPVLCINPATVSPGARARAVLVPLYPTGWTKVAVGSRLYMYEGARECGQAKVMEVWTSDQPHDEDARLRARSWVASD